nr:hypothetical protein [White spot syndrome virus]
MDAILADINGNDTDLSKLITDVIQKRAKAVMDRNRAKMDMNRRVDEAIQEAVAAKKQKALVVFDKLVEETDSGQSVPPTLSGSDYDAWVDRAMPSHIELVESVEGDSLYDKLPPFNVQDIDDQIGDEIDTPISYLAMVVVKVDCETGDIEEEYNLAPTFGVTQNNKIYRDERDQIFTKADKSVRIFKLAKLDSISGKSRQLTYAVKNNNEYTEFVCSVFAEFESDSDTTKSGIGIREYDKPKNEFEYEEREIFTFFIPIQPAGTKLLLYFLVDVRSRII